MSGTAEQTRDGLGFDPDALKKKYLAERDKRLRADGNEQYVEIKGRFAHYLDDPYVTPVRRAPLNDDELRRITHIQSELARNLRPVDIDEKQPPEDVTEERFGKPWRRVACLVLDDLDQSLCYRLARGVRHEQSTKPQAA